MIFKLLFALLPVALVLLASEILWRKKIIQGERARKFIHILSGVWIAFWPFYISLDGIFILGCGALTLLIYSRFTPIFHAIYSVKRKTYGELMYALAIILCAYYAKADWIFTVSILLLALADGAAAIAGKNWGAKNQYRVFGKKSLTKSLVGTSVFVLFAYLSIAIGWLIGGSDYMTNNIALTFLVLPLLVTVAENTMPYGFDNLVNPILATVLLSSLI
jgi:dolichol kinase